MTWEEILKIDSVEKGWMDRLKGKPNPITKDGITFQDQRALDLYNQNIGQYPTMRSDLAGKTVNLSSVEMALDRIAGTQRNSQNVTQPQAKEEYYSAQRQQPKNIPNESVWRRPAY